MTPRAALVPLLASLLVSAATAHAQEEGAPRVRRPVAPQPSAPEGEAAAAPDTLPPVEPLSQIDTAPPPEQAQPAEPEPPPETVDVVRVKKTKKRGKKAAKEAAKEAAEEPAPRKRGSADTAGGRRIQLFLVPVGEAASLAAGAAQAALEAEIARLPGFRTVDLVEELKAPVPAAWRAKVGEAQRVLDDGDRQFASRQFEEAANRYRTAIRAYEAAGTAMEAEDLAGAWARLGAALLMAGEDEAARDAMHQAARFDGAQKTDPNRLDKRAVTAFFKAQEEVAKGASGALSVVSTPPGARVFLNGVYKGLTPVTIERAPAGINHLRADRPGGVPEVRLVEAREGFDTPLKLAMRFTEEAQELQRNMTRMPQALEREKHVPDLVKALGARFSLDRAVVATVAMERANHAGIRACVFDFGRDERLVDEKTVVRTDLEGGLEPAIAKWARTVLDKADGTRDRSSRDPLDHSDGTEDWYSGTRRRGGEGGEGDEEERKSRPAARAKDAKSRDPLENADGTDDW